jgi:hypothetical protein
MVEVIVWAKLGSLGVVAEHLILKGRIYVMCHHSISLLLKYAQKENNRNCQDLNKNSEDDINFLPSYP